MLSRHRFPATIVYGVRVGRGAGAERQRDPRPTMPAPRAGGSRPISTTTSSAISCGSDGVCDDAHVRVLLGRACAGDATPELVAQQRSLGGENDSPSRNLSRFVDGLADELSLGLDVRQIWRTDRFGRGGDHIEFLQRSAIPAVRFTGRDRELQLAAPGSADRERHRLWRHDRPYGLPLSAAGDAAQRRGASPRSPARRCRRSRRWRGRSRPTRSMTLAPVPGADAYVVRWRRTDASQWEQSLQASDGSEIGCIAADQCRCAPSRAGIRSARRAAAHPRRRLGVRRLLGGGGRVGEPGCVRGAGRRVPALRAAAARRSSRSRWRRNRAKGGLPSRQQILDFIAVVGRAGGQARDRARVRAARRRTRSRSRRCSSDMADEGLIDCAPGRAFHKLGGVPKVTVLRVVDVDDSGRAWAVPERWEAEGPPPRLRVMERKGSGVGARRRRPHPGAHRGRAATAGSPIR